MNRTNRVHFLEVMRFAALTASYGLFKNEKGGASGDKR